MWNTVDEVHLHVENENLEITFVDRTNFGQICTVAGSVESTDTLLLNCENSRPSHDNNCNNLDKEMVEGDKKKELPYDKWRILFNKFDSEGFGEISVEQFIAALKSTEFQTNISLNKREFLYRRALQLKAPLGPGVFSFQDFVNIVTGKRRRSFKCAVHHRDREVCSENDFCIVYEEPPLFKQIIRTIAAKILPDERDRKYHADRYSCWPPPYFMFLISALEVAFFVYHLISNGGQAGLTGPIPIESIFIFRPDKRHEFWRFLLYMVLHAGWFHLIFNLCVQLILGLPLEMVHGSGRIACIYFSGVLAGSLGTSVFDHEVFLVGASGGVYALLAAHLANIMLNYSSMRYGIFNLALIITIASLDVGIAIYGRFLDETSSVSYIAHLTGALSGLTIGLVVLKSFEQKLHEQLLWWTALGVYVACLFYAIAFNLINTEAGQRLRK